MMKKYGLIVENNKELKDYIDILNKMSLTQELCVKIVLLADLYKDFSQYETLKNIKFNYSLMDIKGNHNVSFVKLSILDKVVIVLKNKNKIFEFIKDIDILLSGVQTVFQRMLYSQINNNKLPIRTVVYHRHLLFDDGVNTAKTWKSLKIVKYISSVLGLEGFFIDIKAVGFADYYIVLGEVNKKYLVSKGVFPKKVYPLGSLEYDSIEAIATPIKQGTKKSICYITGACEWIGDVEGEFYQKDKLKQYCEFFKDRLDLYEVWIRVHPRESIEKYYNLQTKYPFVKLQYMSDNPLLVDISQFDILIGGMSTVLFEAYLLDKEIIFFILEVEMYRYKKFIQQENIRTISGLSDNELVGQKQEINVISYDKSKKAIERICDFLGTLENE